MPSVADMLAGLPADDRMEFANLYSGQWGAHAGAGMTRLLADWQTILGDPNDDWSYDASTLAARAWDLVHNDANARAMVECMDLGVLGTCGLQFRSQFQSDAAAETSPEERAYRRAIEAAISRVSSRTQLDAGDQLTRRNLSAQLLVSMVVSGDGFAIRTWRPRPGASQGQRWRVIAPERVSTPDDRSDDERMFQGIELDADGVPVAIHVQDRHPQARVAGGAAKRTWTKVPIYAPNGQRNVIHRFKPQRPGQLRGFSWFAPLIILAQHLSKTAEAFVVAKRIQACNPAVLQTDNPKELAAAAAQGSLMGPNLKWKPGMVAVSSRDNAITFPSWQFNGQDYGSFIDMNLRSFTASWGLPFQFVLQQLTDANLAAAQVALDQADKTFSRHQDDHIEQVETHIDEAIVREEIARGRLDLPTDDVALILAGRYQRPRRADANRQRTREAAKAFVDMGGSRSTAFAEMGYEFEDEIRQRAQDDAFMDAQGVSAAAAAPGFPSPSPPPPPKNRDGTGTGDAPGAQSGSGEAAPGAEDDAEPGEQGAAA